MSIKISSNLHNDEPDNYDDCKTAPSMRNKITQVWGLSAPPELNILYASNDDICESSLKTEWLDSREAAEFLRISVKALRNASSNGQIPFYKFGRRNRYRKEELSKLLLTHRRGKHEY
ncbi:MAG: helix-turn-helix domain-containing protein [Bdellovibrionota bacterium]